MGKKIFRLHDDGITNETGWFKSTALTSEQLNSIKTDGKDVATSIPTPFASIDLVKSAFNWVAKNSLEGNTAQHKLVSYALDIGQLFFAYPRYAEKLKIVAYSPSNRFSKLKSEGDKKKKFAETLELFWNQDKAYNFDKTNRLYFILNNQNNQILGSTSPSSLFMSAPDIKTAYKDLNIQIGQHKIFQNTYTPLYDRDKSFILYIYTLSKQRNFAVYFPEFYQYLQKIQQELPSDIISSVTNLTANMIDDYKVCPVLDNVGNPCEVLNIKLGVQGKEKVQSDFEIQPDFKVDEQLPLVLPQYPFSDKWNYVSGVKWDEETRTPYRNEKSPSSSRLPIQNIPHYWLTLGNFLEDKIFELPYNIDSSKFITCGSKRHLLPISPVFFKYFESKNISKLVTITERAGGNVDVELNIPTKGGGITFKKHYTKADKNIEKLPVHLAIFPFVKSDTFRIDHSIALLYDHEQLPKNISIKTLSRDNYQSINNSAVRNPGGKGSLRSQYYKTNNQPDALGISIDSINGIIIPLMISNDGNTEVKFAIDFGTTNTHIEYKNGGDASKALDNTESLPFWVSLLDTKVDDTDPIIIAYELQFEQEILPKSFSNSSSIKFPFRTALSYNKNIDFNNNVEIIKEANNYFLLEHLALRKNFNDYAVIETDIKWSNYADTFQEKKVELFIEFLVTLIYYKTLQLGGNPNTTSITWFYPVSMDEGEREVFFRLWSDIYRNVFNVGTTSKINGIPESLAPYLFYRSEVEGLSLSLDIGGGSSDIAVFDEDDKNAKLISSFKFAGNAIFGDGYPSNEHKNNSDRNGYVKTFKDSAEKALKDGNFKSILNNILNDKKNSADFSSFLFTLENEESFSFNYSRELQKNDKLKLSFLVFYGAIAYYSAKLMEKSGIDIPKYILLSGTASKTASILDPSDDLKNLSYLFEFIFKKVYNKENVEQPIETKLSLIPKELTCKGALKADIEDNIRYSPVKYWIGGNGDDFWSKALDREKDFQKIPNFKDLDDIRKDDVEASFFDFYKILDEYVSVVNVKSIFLINSSSYDVFKDVRSKGIKDLLIKGKNAFYKKDDSKIEDSLFFYPLIGILNKLSYQLALEKSNE